MLYTASGTAAAGKIGVLNMRLGLGLGLARSTGGGGGPETFNSIGVAGDSLGDNLASAINYARFALYNADIPFDNRSYASGGMKFNVGGSTTAQMLSTQLPQIQARVPDILFIISGRNNSIGSTGDADNAYNDITAVATAARTAGAKRVYIFPTNPDNSVNRQRSLLEYLHGRLVTFAAAEPNIEFLDIFSEWIDLAELTFARWNLATDALGSYTHDNTHGSLTFDRYLATKFSTIFSSLGLPTRTPTASALLGVYNPVSNPFAHVNGNNALFTGTNGQLNGANNTGVAGASASAQDRWGINTTNGAVATPTIGTDEGGFNAQIITFSGTPSADATITLTGTFGFFGSGVNNGDTSRLFVVEALLQLENVTGLYGVTGGANGLDFTVEGLTDTRSEAHRFPDNTTQRLFIRTNVPTTVSSSSPSMNIAFKFKSGVPISGSVKISRAPYLRVV